MQLQRLPKQQSPGKEHFRVQLVLAFGLESLRAKDSQFEKVKERQLLWALVKARGLDLDFGWCLLLGVGALPNLNHSGMG